MKDKNSWPTISQAINTQTPLKIAELNGAVELLNHTWLFKGKKVTEEFLEDYYSKKI